MVITIAWRSGSGAPVETPIARPSRRSRAAYADGVERDRIIVDDDGTTVVYAPRSRTPGWTSFLPWSQTYDVALVVTALPPDDERVVSLDVGTTFGELLTVDSDADGFAEAVVEFARRGDVPAPDLDQMPPGRVVTLWRVT